ncbi:conserved hypothetical protein [Anaeromyxobacter dehalogenans 2CP-1]|uniref:PepSY domain-containing protein n=1 Tax=Anaeromyxobacter dehalogenans (strain ATCC BAA-258 / DSM 21875 / 2CP-1) TaxID=455488 RepID=B8JBU5_ANAD2|nr:hypothetical protein [Anaeromyxobacter dehalogenans]ACL67703.1 conserved hypothetical protein [Anaeromyxobacter dehalogenans 2CP-1]
MRALAAAALLFLAGCVTYSQPPENAPPPAPEGEAPPEASPPPPPPPPAPSQAEPAPQPTPPRAPQAAPPTATPPAPQAAPPAQRPGYLGRDQAIDAAFRVARERRLQVDTVKHAFLDEPAARWHVDVAGPRDFARVVLDARDGRLLKGRFRAGAADAGPEQRAP